MFALVHGAWPRVTDDGVDLDGLETDVAAGRGSPGVLRDATERLLARVIEVQVEAGVELVTDGQVRWPSLHQATLDWLAAGPPGPGESPMLAAWRDAASLTDLPVAQSLPGPYTLGQLAAGTRDEAGGGATRGRAHSRRATPAAPGGVDARRREAQTLAFAGTLAGELRALGDAGCPVVLVEEPRAVDVGEDAAERELFAEAQRRLLSEAPGVHAMLVVSGGSAHLAGPDAILSAPYRSYLFDLIAGPDNWYLVRATPGDRGVVAGALEVGDRRAGDQAPLLVWAAGYAASSAGRGMDRVGLSNASPLRHLRPQRAAELARELGRAARLAAMGPDDAIAAGLDRRTFAQPASRTAGARRRAGRRRPEPGPAGSLDQDGDPA